MKNYLAIVILALAVAGCSSYSEIARWDGRTSIEGGEVPVATFLTQNFSYQLLWVIPICTGLPWTEGKEEIVDEFNVELFADEATIDNNLKSLKHALDLTGSRRITDSSDQESEQQSSGMISFIGEIAEDHNPEYRKESIKQIIHKIHI